MSAQNRSTFLIIDTLDCPENYNIYDWDAGYILSCEDVDEVEFTKKCKPLFRFKGVIVSHDSRYWLGSHEHDEPNKYDICFEFISDNKSDIIAFPLDNNGGLLHLNNAWNYDTIFIPRYSILKNDIPDSVFTLIEYDKIMRDTSYKFIGREAFWSKPKNGNVDNTGARKVLINNKQYIIIPQIGEKEERSTFNGYKYRRYTIFHKLLGIRQVSFGGVTVEKYKTLNAFIELK